ncbi:MAG: 3-isopropylmalate dehydratase small subunit [Thermoanaerobacterales bacterium]|nr:3-isopropylmalate dehydratase small subunit [Bacillota bacterium]MDI6907965.1 3-isopropylmalate dehydratase small subunit [Thermoanaerobacterales bacterium]
MLFEGRAWKFGDNIDTDVIIPARYLNTSDPKELAAHAMEDADPTFAARVQPGDIIVGGSNFGCGSSREHAPLALKHAGVACVIAASFARIFYRNAFNIGLPILECPEAAAAVNDGDRLRVDAGTGRITNLTTGAEYTARPIPSFMQEIVARGGLIEWVKARLESK